MHDYRKVRVNVADLASLSCTLVCKAGANNVGVLGARRTQATARPRWPLDSTGSASPTVAAPRTPTN